MRFFTKQTFVIVTFIVLWQGFANASTPLTEMADALSDTLDQPRQYNAFQCLVESFRPYNEKGEYTFMTPEPEYDSTLVKDAFETMVRFIALNYPNQYQTGFTPTLGFGFTGNEENEPDWETGACCDLLLSLYISWGFTQVLYEIADGLYERNGQSGYFTFLWDSMGIGYFNHVYSKIQSDTTEYILIRVATDYLLMSRVKNEALSSKAIDIINYGTSGSINQRWWTAGIILQPYMAGYYQFKDEIDSLMVDPDPDTAQRIRNQIRTLQKRNLGREFLGK